MVRSCGQQVVFSLNENRPVYRQPAAKQSLPPDAPESWGISDRHVPSPFGMGSCG